MGISLGGFFGGGSKQSKQTTTTSTSTADMRTAIGGNAENLISPGAAVAGGGAIVAGQGARVTQSLKSTGLSGSDVQGIIGQIQADRNAERESIGSLGASLAGGLQAQAAQLGDIVAATKAPEASTLTTLLPVLIIVVLIMAMKR